MRSPRSDSGSSSSYRRSTACGSRVSFSRLPTPKHFDARKRFAFKVFQRCTTAGGYVREGVLLNSQRAHRCGGVTPTDHTETALAGCFDDRLGDAAGARRVFGELEHAHRAVPEDG